MTKVKEGKLIGKGKKFAIVIARFNEFIGSKLLSGALDCFVRHDVSESDIEVVWVPGAYEIPLIAKKLAESKKYDTVLTLGAVIRGSTPHFDYVCAEVSKGVSRVALDTGVPTIFGVITTENLEQAIERAGTKSGNKGWETALAAIEMATLIENL